MLAVAFQRQQWQQQQQQQEVYQKREKKLFEIKNKIKGLMLKPTCPTNIVPTEDEKINKKICI